MFTYLGETIIKRSCRVRRTLNTPDKNIKEAIVPYGITTIDDCFHHEGIMFSGCSSLVNITIPNSVTKISKSAFEGCSSLTNITIPNSVI